MACEGFGQLSRKEITYFHIQSLSRKCNLFVVCRGATIFNVGYNVACHVAPKQLHFRGELFLRPTLLVS